MEDVPVNTTEMELSSGSGNQVFQDLVVTSQGACENLPAVEVTELPFDKQSRDDRESHDNFERPEEDSEPTSLHRYTDVPEAEEEEHSIAYRLEVKHSSLA